MPAETEVLIRPTAGRLSLYFIFAWLVSSVCGFSTIFTAGIFFKLDISGGFTLRETIIRLVAAVLHYGSGAYILGTLTWQRIKTWTSSIIYIIPFFLFQALMFAHATASEVIKKDYLTNAGLMIVIPVACLLVSPFVSFFFVRIGEKTASTFSRPRAVLNVPWPHWTWILPLFLFQVTSVPLFLFLTIFKVDVLAGVHVLPFSQVLGLRIIVLAVLAGTIKAIECAYKALSVDHGSIGIRALKVIGTWLLLSAMQIAFILVGIRHYSGN